MNDVMICVFGTDGMNRAVEGLAGAGKKLAGDLDGKLHAIIVGAADEHLMNGLTAVADRVLLSDNEELSEYQPEICLSVLEQLCRQQSPRVVLFGSDSYSQELMPVLAHRLGGGSISDGIELSAGEGTLRVTRSAYGGKATAVYEIRRFPIVVSIRSRSFDPADAGGSACEVIRPGLELPDTITTKIIERHVEKVEGIPLEDAQLIVSGGRGIGGPEGFTDVQKLADVMNAGIGGSRAACDEGWIPPTWQIGQTGKKVAPELYVAIGISGASQHLLGMADSKVIAAVNTDAEAPIFKHAAIGIVEDYRKVIPALTEKLAGMKQ